MTTLDTGKNTIADAVARDGWYVTAPCVPQLTLDNVAAELESVAADAEFRGGVRDLFNRFPAARALATSRAVRDVAEAVLGPHCLAVRATYFDRLSRTAHRIIWHQDLTIAVRRRERVDGYGPWTEKDGIPHVDAPAELLEGMLEVRVHLDDCGPANGPMLVLPGSHRVGRLSGAAIDAWRAGADPVACTAERGAIHVLRPLLLHSSAPATTAERRRVVQFDFASAQLPAPLEWHVELS